MAAPTKAVTGMAARAKVRATLPSRARTNERNAQRSLHQVDGMTGHRIDLKPDAGLAPELKGPVYRCAEKRGSAVSLTLPHGERSMPVQELTWLTPSAFNLPNAE